MKTSGRWVDEPEDESEEEARKETILEMCREIRATWPPSRYRQYGSGPVEIQEVDERKYNERKRGR